MNLLLEESEFITMETVPWPFVAVIYALNLLFLLSQSDAAGGPVSFDDRVYTAASRSVGGRANGHVTENRDETRD